MKFPLAEAIVSITVLASSTVLVDFNHAVAQEATPPPARTDIEKIVREYILQHPEVLLDSIRMYQERERASQQQRLKDALKQRQAELTRDPAAPFAGEPGSTVTMVEF